MKTRRNKVQGLYLKKSNNRWKWMAGATAAGVTASQASAITISLVNNYISATGGNHLNADLTGDGHPDLTIVNTFYRYSVTYTGSPSSGYHGPHRNVLVAATLNAVYAYGIYTFTGGRHGLILGSKSKGGYGSLAGSIPLFFKDLHINGGAPTKGSLQVTVFNGEIDLNSFTYISNTAVQGLSRAVPDQGSSRAVPDQGSSLALLAMGAGGVLALRRWRAAQGPS
jgi:hypothetical protein